MENTYNPPIGHIQAGASTLAFWDQPSRFGRAWFRLPVVLRLLLDNVVRHTQGAEQAAAVAAILGWLDQGTSEAEIPYQPGRVLMHDTTSTPALVDIAAMRDTLAEAGVDPEVLNPVLQVDVSVDHSLAVEVYGRGDAAEVNMQHEMRRNRERYRFLRWAAGALKGVRIHPPGTGIMHTINLEQLATVVATGLTADCTGLGIDDKRNLMQTRPAFGGNIMATIMCDKFRPQMATVRPHVMPMPEKQALRLPVSRRSVCMSSSML